MKLNYRKYIVFILLTVLATIAASCGRTGEVVGFNTDGDGRAIRGYDAVAYFALETAVEGNPKYELVWNGAKWLFSSAENLERFRSDPEAYAPQFGGYCAYAVSKGYTANGDPHAWKVVNGKLYLNYSQEVKAMWEQDMENRIVQGEKNWAGFKTKKPEHKG